MILRVGWTQGWKRPCIKPLLPRTTLGVIRVWGCWQEGSHCSCDETCWLFPVKILLQFNHISLYDTLSFSFNKSFSPALTYYGLQDYPPSSFLCGEGTDAGFIWSCCLPTSTATLPAPAWLFISAGVPLLELWCPWLHPMSHRWSYWSPLQ